MIGSIDFATKLKISDGLFWNFSHDCTLYIGPLSLKYGECCLVGVGNGEAYILKSYVLFLGYNLYKNQWKTGTLPPGQHGMLWSMHRNSCIFYQKKNYER